jgi:hypothetical protein
MSELPVFTHEVRFYRDVLRVAYETGSRFRKLGVLTRGHAVRRRPAADKLSRDREPKTVGAGQNSTYAQLNNVSG